LGSRHFCTVHRLPPWRCSRRHSLPVSLAQRLVMDTVMAAMVQPYLSMSTILSAGENSRPPLRTTTQR
jgi:hypothetical protein